MNEGKMESEGANKLVEFTSVQGDMEAEIIRGVLESEGIKVLIKSDIVHSVHPITVDGLGEVRIYVRKRDYLRAKVVLSEYEDKDRDDTS
ncbi:MAG: DUF2007 domain-containing protein [Candidatus Krumholzibacteria bacterium]|nr:DUF2007 domain-containing protein [Candidatus Krumholzibacteria bacterium]